MSADQTDHESSHVGPIIFADETARTQLIEEGEVVTFRTSERTTGETWWRKSRTGEKLGDVTVELLENFVLAAPNSTELIQYTNLSGFENTEAWVEAIDELNDDVEGGRLYRVTEGHNGE